MYEMMHSVIAIDNELRIRLNGGIYDENHFEANQSFISVVREIYPEWRKYLANKNENIFQFIERMKEMANGPKNK